MREIKFRAMHKDKLVWEYFKIPDHMDNDPWFPDDWINWCQYTGINDKNNVEIYEGDIISNEYKNGEVVWDNQQAWFELVFQRDTDNEGARTLSYFIFNFVCKVIGNIYETPELLEGEK